MKSRLLTKKYDRYDAASPIFYVMPDGYYTIDELSDCDESEVKCNVDEVWLAYNKQTLAEYIAVAYETVSMMLIKVFHRKYAGCTLRLKKAYIDDGYEAVIVHDNGMIQLYPRIYEGEDGGDVSDDISEYFDYEDVEYGDSIGGDAYLVSNGKLYNYQQR